LSDNRWVCRNMNIEVTEMCHVDIIAVLIEVSKLRGVLYDDEIRTIAARIFNDVRFYQFVANLIILKKILSFAHGVNEMLQYR